MDGFDGPTVHTEMIFLLLLSWRKDFFLSLLSWIFGFQPIGFALQHCTDTWMWGNRCEKAPNKLTGRMLSAEKAVHSWSRMLPDIKRVAHEEQLRKSGAGAPVAT
jgi:hypothetical protein